MSTFMRMICSRSRAGVMGRSLRSGLAVSAVLCFMGVLPTRAEWRCVPSAHRGERAQAFDNSVAAIRAAVGIPYVEIDIRVTADNDLILFHDRRLSAENYRGPHGFIGRPVSSLSREEVASIRFPDGARIPKLRTALSEVEGRGITLMLDVKSTSVRDFKRVMAEVYESGAESRVVVQCQTEDLLRYMRTVHPKIAVLARAHHESDVSVLLGHSPQFVQVNDTWKLSRLVPMLHKRDARVVVKTLTPETDTPAVWRTLCEVGIDVVLTDRPRDFLKSHSRGEVGG